MRYLSYIFYNYFFKYVLKLYLRTDSNIKFHEFRLKVFKDVFHPKLFFSTSYLYSFLQDKNFKGKKFLEIGCGSGILSLLAFKRGAMVTALDIDPKAVENTLLNFKINFPEATGYQVIQSDVFTNLRAQTFDLIVVNPPYYFKKITSTPNYAWYCGENGEYFERLFGELKNYVLKTSEIYMVLEEGCELDRIEQIANKNNVKMKLADEKKIKWEKNFIYQLSCRSFPGN